MRRIELGQQQKKPLNGVGKWKKTSPRAESIGFHWIRISDIASRRLSVLVTLLLVQSISSFILERYQTLLSEHVNIMLFLTMLIGAGGNAANQSAVRVIRDIAIGKVSFHSHYFILLSLLMEEALIGLSLGLVLSFVGFLRAGMFLGLSNLWTLQSLAIVVSVSLFIIVVSAVLVGTSLPLLLNGLGLDPAIAGPSVQVFMDISGVLITCMVATWIFD